MPTRTWTAGERERILALGAAHLARTRAGEGGNPADEDVRRIGFAEFALLLDSDAACTALGEAVRGG
ncbi:hypothetical protein [Streptomyces sp. NPDC051183]|uniref:hypothetical protein n=1 Tax=Streptomyces sp. NPDC051183 TaxID=3155165 RepID=UPI00341D7F05